MLTEMVNASYTFFPLYYPFLALLLLLPYVLVICIQEPGLLQVEGSNFDTVVGAAIPVPALRVHAGGNLRMWIASTEMRRVLLFQTAL